MHILDNQKRFLALPALLLLGVLCYVLVLGKQHSFTWSEVFLLGTSFILSFYVSLIILGRKLQKLVGETLASLESAIINFNAEGKLYYFNPAAAVMLPELASERSAEDIFGTYKKFLSYIYDRSLDIKDQTRLTLGISNYDETRLIFREVIELSNRKIVLAQFYQKPSREITAVLTDISIMKNHVDEMAALTEENRIMIKAMEASGSGLLIAHASDLHESVIFGNEMFAQIIGRAIESIINQPFQKILEEHFAENLVSIKSAMHKARTGQGNEQIWLKIKQKNMIAWYAFSVLFLRESDREFYVCLLSNQTESRLTQARLHQSQKLEAVAKLAGGIAHDFNNVLSVIDGYSKIIRRSLAKGQDVSTFFDNIERGVARGTEITNKLLTFGQCHIKERIRLDICAQIRDLEPFIKQMLNDRINLIMSVQETACHADFSPDALIQIVMELTANARDAMPEGGDLIVSVSEATRSQILSFQLPAQADQKYICVQIIDSGTGMDIDAMSKIYDPFFTTKDSTLNTGLGMSLVYGLVRETESLIDVKSTPGVGTSVSILIPCRESSAIHKNKPEEQKDLSGIQGKTILVVEDLPDLLDMQGRMLTERGLIVLKAGNGKEALQHFDKGHHIDFLLSDITMPGMNGIELSDAVAVKSPSTKIILVSAYPDIMEPEQISGRNVLAKPFVFRQLENILVETYSGKNQSFSGTRKKWEYEGGFL